MRVELASKFYFNSIVLAKREINLIKVVHSVVNIPNVIINMKFAMEIINNDDFKTWFFFRFYTRLIRPFFSKLISVLLYKQHTFLFK